MELNTLSKIHYQSEKVLTFVRRKLADHEKRYTSF